MCVPREAEPVGVDRRCWRRVVRDETACLQAVIPGHVLVTVGSATPLSGGLHGRRRHQGGGLTSPRCSGRYMAMEGSVGTVPKKDGGGTLPHHVEAAIGRQCTDSRVTAIPLALEGSCFG